MSVHTYACALHVYVNKNMSARVHACRYLIMKYYIMYISARGRPDSLLINQSINQKIINTNK